MRYTMHNPVFVKNTEVVCAEYVKNIAAESVEYVKNTAVVCVEYVKNMIFMDEIIHGGYYVVVCCYSLLSVVNLLTPSFGGVGEVCC